VTDIESVGDDVFNWSVSINGPPDTPYSGGKFCFLLEFPAQYPFKAPKVSRAAFSRAIRCTLFILTISIRDAVYS
jgi:ubiquitin-protein ligase